MSSTRGLKITGDPAGPGVLASPGSSSHPLDRPGLWALFFLLGRGVLLLSLPYEALRAYGDLWNFYRLAAMPGWPYLDYWVEFPPLYPLLAEVFYRLAGGREHAFVYLHVLGMTMAQAGSVYLFARLVRDDDAAFLRLAFYVFLHMGLFYTWGYFDVLAVFFLLLGLWAALRNRFGLVGLALGLGGLAKWFPLVVLLVFLPYWGKGRGVSWRRVVFVWGLAWFVVVGLWGVLWMVGNGYTQYSWLAQSQRPPWESPWALFHKRLATGNFPAYDRTRPPPRNATFPAWERALPWAAFAALLLLGFGLFRRRHPPPSKPFLLQAAWVLGAFFLTSWGYSPQWVLYTLPLFLLVLPWPTAALWSLLWLLLHLVEWPLALSRGWFETLWALVPMRMLVLGFGMGLLAFPRVRHGLNPTQDPRQEHTK